jgi:hypothetical protein
MNKQDNLKPENQQSVVEDLTITQDQEAEVKGGPIYMKVEGIDGDVTSTGYDKQISLPR